MENSEFGMRELYDCVIKSTQNIEINGKQFEEGEVIALFDKIQLANFKTIYNAVAATGGFDNRAYVTWQTAKEQDFQFVSGIFSKTQLALMKNSKLVQTKKDSIRIHKREKIETDENGRAQLSEESRTYPYVYDENWNKLTYHMETGNKSFILEGNNIAYKNLTVDYEYLYNNNCTTMVVGRELLSGFVYLEAKTRFKDDITGVTRTGIIRIPKLKIMSDFIMRLGDQAGPQVGSLKAIGCPVGDRYNSRVMEILFLEDDIDSDSDI